MSVLFILLLFASCTGDISDKKVELKTADDSISFAVSMLVSEDMPVAMEELGINDNTLPAFLRGIKDAFPVDESPEAVAYAQGVLMAASAMDMLERADKAIYPDDTSKKVNRKMFLEGLIATAYGTGKTMTTQDAKEYYNRRVFRTASDEFIAKNKERRGVTVLSSGLQYKIEKMGTGDTATIYDTVSCIYKGSFPNGAVFDSARGEATELQVRTLIPGLAEALTTLPVGTKCKLYIPWELAYGSKGTHSVPPYSALVYDLEIVGIVGK
jgi:FKBP-type peptidyl-prolyl cis-trans isomerase FklB